MPQVEQSETSEASLIDVDQPHVETVPSNFTSQEIKTETQAAQHEREADDAAKPQAGTNNQEQREQKRGTNQSKLRKNTDNPVLLGNAVVTAALAGVLGWTGYRWYQQGVAGSKIFGGAIAAIGVFATADYFGSRWLLSKHPPRN